MAKNIDILKKTDKLYFYAQMFAYVKKKLYLCSVKGKQNEYADII